MQAERDHLRMYVFPALEERLHARRAHLEWVDLRLGVAAAAQADVQLRELQVLKVCLAEVRRCRPFLIVLLGDRYGWVPPTERSAAAVAEEGFDPDVIGRSVTDLEIRYGVLADSQQQSRSFFYFREPLPYSDMPQSLAALYSDALDSDPAAGDRARKLAELKRLIETSLPDRVRHYAVGWDRDRQSVTGLEPWGRRVLEDVWSEILAVAGPTDVEEDISWQFAERTALDDYIEDRARDFFGREQILARLTGLAFSPAQQGVSWGACLTGNPGSGKSAIFGQLCRRMRQNNTFLLAHAAGASARAPSAEDMLRRWTGELATGLDTDSWLPDNANLETIETTFHHLLERTAAQRRVIVLIDAMDQFEPTSRARFMTWLPRAWPLNARLITTAVPCDASKALNARSGIEMLALPPLDAIEALGIANGICARYHRTLEPEVLDALLAKLDQDGPDRGNTLWLVLAVEELNLVDADDFARATGTFSGTVAEQLRALMVDIVAGFPSDILGLYGASFDRAEEIFGRNLARAFLGLIAISRAGWRESDFRSLLPQLSSELWDELRFASLRRLFRGQIRQRGTLDQWDFTHGQMRAAMRQRLVAQSVSEAHIHAEVAEHLLSLMPDDPMRRTEAMVHLLGSEDWVRTANFYGAALQTSAELELATREFARAFDDATAEGRNAVAEQIADTLLRALTTKDRHSQLILGRVNAWLTYRPKSHFLRTALTRGAHLDADLDSLDNKTRILASRCRGRLGEQLRREGNHEQAEALLRPMVGPVRWRGITRRAANSVVGRLRRWTSSDAARLERTDHGPPKAAYELGYVEFRRGSLSAARVLFEHSSNLDAALGNRTGAWISRCLAGNCDFISQLSEASVSLDSGRSISGAEAFRRILLKALAVFKAEAATGDPIAARWIWNVSSHLFEIAYSQRDRSRGKRYFDDFMRNDWARHFDQAELLLPYQARHEMLEQRWAAAVELFRQYFQSIKLGPENYQEALARVALDYGEALIQNGQQEEAHNIWGAALNLPADAGNRPWQSLIQQRLGNPTL